jgi:hypothetical protein
VFLGLGSWASATPSGKNSTSTDIALKQLGAQARDIVVSSRDIQEVAARTTRTGRPVEMATLESDIHQLQIDLADLDKLLAQVERSWSTHSPDELSTKP